jgi:hypothetical protein
LGGDWVAKDVLTTIARVLGFTEEFFLDHVDENGGDVREAARQKCCCDAPRFLISLNGRSNSQQWSNHGQPGPSPRKTH